LEYGFVNSEGFSKAKSGLGPIPHFFSKLAQLPFSFFSPHFFSARGPLAQHSPPEVVLTLDPSCTGLKKEKSSDDQREEFVPNSNRNEFDQTLDSLSNLTPL
jgi:hypothetical protein